MLQKTHATAIGRSQRVGEVCDFAGEVLPVACTWTSAESPMRTFPTSDSGTGMRRRSKSLPLTFS